MGKKFDWLDSYKNESVKGYDKRINQSSIQLAGYIFFDHCNYDLDRHAFATYIIWNGELNKKFQDPFPQGGYEVHCSQNDADLFCQNKAGIPVYLKILAKNRRLYAKNIIIKFHNKLFMVSFTGCQVRIPDQICFHGFVKEQLDMYTEKCISDYANNEMQTEPGIMAKLAFRNRKANRRLLSNDAETGNLLRSSFPAGSAYCLRGSFPIGSAYRLQGSFPNGSAYRLLESFPAGSGYRMQGSFSLGSGNYVGSGFLGSGFLGSGFLGSGFRMFFEHEYEYETGTGGSYSVGSGFRWRENLFGSGLHLQGSFLAKLGGRLQGSFVTGSGGRLQGRFVTGSAGYLQDSYIPKKVKRRQENDLLGCGILPKKNTAEVISLSGEGEEDLFEPKSREELEKEIYEQAMKEIFGVGFLGYGLNLI